MRRRTTLVLVCILMLPACQPGTVLPTPSPEPPAPPFVQPPELAFDGHLDFERNGMNIILPMPKGWESMDADDGMIIAERFARLSDHGVQQGLMAFVFVTPLSELADIGDPNGQRAVEILKHFIEIEPDEKQHSSEVQALPWNGFDAAYYLISEANSGPQMLVAGVILPDQDVLVTGAVSAPRVQAGMIRDAAPLLLGGVTVNGVVLGPDAFDTLPDPLVFPE